MSGGAGRAVRTQRGAGGGGRVFEVSSCLWTSHWWHGKHGGSSAAATASCPPGRSDGWRGNTQLKGSTLSLFLSHTHAHIELHGQIRWDALQWDLGHHRPGWKETWDWWGLILIHWLASLSERLGSLTMHLIFVLGGIPLRIKNKTGSGSAHFPLTHT